MKAVFIADAHLKGPGDPNQERLCSFLDSLKDVDRLFILGDLFEFWTGYNKTLERIYSPVLERFRKLSEKGVGITYIEGNHDFAVSPFFKDVLGCDVYPDFADMNLDGKRLYAAHGDIVENSIGYRMWRGFLRSAALKMLIRITPPGFVWKTAVGLARKSRKNNNRGAILEKLQILFAMEKISRGFDIVILAHSHYPIVTEEKAAERKGVFANPGDWINDFSYLVLENGKIRLERFAADSNRRS